MTLLRNALFTNTLAIGTLAIPALLASTSLHARPMTPEDVAKIESAGGSAISRDGSHIAFTSFSRPDVTQGEENGGSSQELFLADGPMQMREYLPEDMAVSSIGFSPDGSMITFLHRADKEKRALWGVPVAGGRYHKLAEIEDANISSYAIAPDGGSVYLLVSAPVDEDREEEEDAGFDSEVYEEEFRFNRLFNANLTLGEPDEDPEEISVRGYVNSLQIAPDGNFLVLQTAPTPLIDNQLTSNKVQIMDLMSGSVLTVDTPGKIGDVEISPDSTQLSMVAAVDANDPAATTLHLVDVATGNYRALNAGAAEAAVDGEWMADGRLASIIHKGAQSVLRFYSPQGQMESEIDPEGLILTNLTQGGNRLIARANAPSHPSEFFMFDGYGFDRWSDHNPWLSQIDFGAQRTITYTATDGQEIEGILIEPVGGVADLAGAPTIFNVHGGPESHDSNGWVTGYGSPGQVAAGQGYAVFLPNYRGSTGYGVEFSKQHQGRYTDPEFRDLVDGKAALVEMGIADPSRVGMTGGSYGGYATAWSSTYNSEEFAAGVMFVGISNQISKVGTGDIPQEMYLVHARSWPWDDWQKYLEVSPIYYADRADTPLLIMHGDSDPRVSPTQSTEMYRNIKIRRPDTPLRLVFYPGEGHGNRQAAARYDYNLRMMRWFDTYLKSGDRDAPLPPSRPDLQIEDDE